MFYHLGWLWPLGLSLHLLNPYCSFSNARIFVLLFIQMIFWSSLTQHMLARSQSFLCSLLLCLGLHINFSKSELHLTQQTSFLYLCWDSVTMSLSLQSEKLIEIQQLPHSCYKCIPLQFIRICPFWERQPLVPVEMHNFAICALSLRVIC